MNFRIHIKDMTSKGNARVVVIVTLAIMVCLGLWLISRNHLRHDEDRSESPRERPSSNETHQKPFSSEKTEMIAVGGLAKPAGVQSVPVEPGLGKGWTSEPIPNDREAARLQLRERNGRMIDAIHKDMYDALKFTAEQQAKFREIELNRRDEINRLQRAAAGQQTTGGRETAKLTLDVVEDQVDPEYDKYLAETFGQDTFEQIKRFESERLVRNIVTGIDDQLRQAGASLTPDQRDRLISSIAFGALSSAGQLDFSRVDLEAQLAKAGDYLSPPQLAALRSALSQRIERAKIRNSGK